MTEKHWHAMDPDEVLKELRTEAKIGLNSKEILKRLDEYGYNELKQEEKISTLTIFLNQFKNILILILVLAIILSMIVGELLDAAIIMIIVVFCALLGFIQEYRAGRAMEALKKMLAPTITVIRGGKTEEVPSKDLVPGDILLIEPGDRIPADVRLIEAHSLRCDEAPLTGESAPVGKHTEVLSENTSVADRKNMAFTGTTVTYGRAKAVVTATGMESEFGKIAKEVAVIEMEKTPLEKRTQEIGKWLGIICLGICVLVIGISVVRGWLAGPFELKSIVTMIMFAVALAVAVVPEALAAIVTGALALGMHAMAKRNALVRKMPAVETLGCTTVICSDKTGTLTKGEMTVRKVFSNNRGIEVSGVGYAPEGSFSGFEPGAIMKDNALRLFLQGGLLCNDADLDQKEGKWTLKGDPTEGALVVAAVKAGMNIKEWRSNLPRIEEIPFSSERKRMTTIHRKNGARFIAFMKGAPEAVLERCPFILEGDEIADLTAEKRDRVRSINEEMARDALRVIAVAYKELKQDVDLNEGRIEADMVFLGFAGMIDPPREEVIDAVKICKKIHIKTIMVTGDHKLTAMAIAKELAIYQEGDLALTGEELEGMSDDQFEEVVEKVTVYARVAPLTKLKIVKAWKMRGEVVAMTGDGVNDSPALRNADIGIAMGITGTDVAKEASDMVLSDDNFATIVAAIERGRWIYSNIKKYLTYLIRCNITEVVVIGGVVLISGPEYLPLLPAAILYINLATDGLPALALGVSPPDPDIMDRPPRDPKESVFSWDVKAFVFLALLIECPIFLGVFYHEFHNIVHARTEIFFMFVIIELIIALNFRSLKYSIFSAPPHKWLLIAIIWELFLVALLIQFPAIRNAFGILKPTTYEIGLILGVGLFVMISLELVKALIRKKLKANK